MAFEGRTQTITITAAEATTSYQYLPFTAAGIRAYGTLGKYQAIGICQDKVASGENFTAAWEGKSKFKAGGAISAGGNITINASAYFVACTSGVMSVGKAVAAVTSGSVGTGLFNFCTRYTTVVSFV